MASASRPVVGSSSSQSGAGLAMRRASAKRRRWPAESRRQGQSASGARRKWVERRARRAAAAHAGPEGERLADRQHALQRVVMADEMESPAMRRRVVGDRDALPGDDTRLGPREPGQEAQEARLAAAVGAGQHESAVGRERKGKPGEDQPLASPAGDIRADQSICRLGRGERRRHGGRDDATRCPAIPPKNDGPGGGRGAGAVSI